jgi:hypothetical protein
MPGRLCAVVGTDAGRVSRGGLDTGGAKIAGGLWWRGAADGRGAYGRERRVCLALPELREWTAAAMADLRAFRAWALASVAPPRRSTKLTADTR